MPILRRPSQSNIAADDAVSLVPEESGAFPVTATTRRATLKMSPVDPPRPVPISSIPPFNELPSLVVPPPSPPPSSPMGVRPSVKRNTVRMAVVKTTADETPPSGRMLDAIDFADGARVSLELGAMPAGHAQALGRPATPVPRPKTPLNPITPVGGSEVIRRSDLRDPRRPGIFAFAGFGLPPETLAGTPAYALRVIARQSVLREGLAVARRQRSVDVDLYEAALRMADRASYLKGLGVLGGAAVAMIAVLGVVLTALF